jgi:hypothetical protein
MNATEIVSELLDRHQRLSEKVSQQRADNDKLYREVNQNAFIKADRDRLAAENAQLAKRNDDLANALRGLLKFNTATRGLAYDARARAIEVLDKYIPF